MPQISASVSSEVIIKISEMAVKEKRTFSQMVNILLTEATQKSKSQTKNKHQ